MPRLDVKSLLSTCSCLLRLALSKCQRLCQCVECVGSFGPVLWRMLRTCWAHGGQTLPLTCACCCFPSCSCILASICCIRWICGAKPRAMMKGPCKHRHIYVMINICCIRWICGARSHEQWWNGCASTGIFLLWSTSAVSARSWCKAMSNDEMAAGVFMLSSTSAASIGSVKQSHEQWYIYQHLLHQLDPQKKANATAR